MFAKLFQDTGPQIVVTLQRDISDKPALRFAYENEHDPSAILQYDLRYGDDAEGWRRARSEFEHMDEPTARTVLRNALGVGSRVSTTAPVASMLVW